MEIAGIDVDDLFAVESFLRSRNVHIGFVLFALLLVLQQTTAPLVHSQIVE